jgi:uncharacterized membrane protein YqaE (UPF0057 family)
MRKVILGLIILFVGSQLMVSCSADNTVLSQFSKRKYLKKSKKVKVNYEDEIDSYEYASVEIEEPEVEEIVITKVEEIDVEAMSFDVENLSIESVMENNEAEVDYSNWNKYNRDIDLSVYSEERNVIENLNRQKRASQVNEVVLVILCIFIPPLAVYLFEDAITTNFWIDLIATLLFWFPGMIVAFLICFANLSFE